MTPTRRLLLRSGLSACATLSFGLPKLALASATTDRRFVLIVLRGGLDGLGAVIPYADPAYGEVRGDLAAPDPGTDGGPMALDGFFALHPALAPLMPWWQANELLVAHAVATPYRERSHFDGQDLLENGTGRPHGRDDGWLNRAIGLLGGDGRRLGLALGQGVPLVLRGGAEVASWAPSTLPEAAPDFLDRIAELYRGDPLFGPTLEAGLAADAMADHVLEADGATMGGKGGAGGRVAKGGSGRRLDRGVLATTSGRLLAAPDGPRIAVMDLPGWDTHVAQGSVAGRLAGALRQLADGLTALRVALGPAWAQTTVAVVTEFGRTVRPNGTGGTDHGTGGVALLAGGAVAGGRVLADWPGLAPAQLYQGRDLAPTMDLRAVLKAVLHDHLEIPRDALDRVVFPETGGLRPAEGIIAV